MEVRRIFVDKLKMKNGMVLVTGPNASISSPSFEKATGDRIDVMDGKGYLYRCIINAIRARRFLCTSWTRSTIPRKRGRRSPSS